MAKVSQEDLRVGYLAIRSDLINFPELHWCLNRKLKLGNAATPLSRILVSEGYITKEDTHYLQMLLESNPEKDQERYPMLAAGDLDLKEIYREYTEAFKAIRPGGRFGSFDIHAELGRGGMGVVFDVTTADEPEQHKALKILGGRKKSDVKAIELFKKEATIMSQIRHRNIVEIYEVGRENGFDYIVMELIDGVSLKLLVEQDDVLPAGAGLKFMRGVSEALNVLHNMGIYHRDLKPDNVVIDGRGRPVLMDFGLAAFDKIEVQGVRGSVGTPLFQPPEQAEVGGRWGPITSASDVYGLGATLYFILTGQPPFTGSTRTEIREKIFKQRPDAPHEVNQDIPEEVSALIMRCLEKDQKKRFKTVKELIAEIDAYFDANRRNRPKARGKVPGKGQIGGSRKSPGKRPGWFRF